MMEFSGKIVLTPEIVRARGAIYDAVRDRSVLEICVVPCRAISPCRRRRLTLVWLCRSARVRGNAE